MRTEREAAWSADDERNRRLYRSLLEQHGHSSPLALNWSTVAGQRDRFAVFFNAGIPRDASVLDVGCGLGDFRAYLIEHDHQGEYCGIDLTPEMIAAARSRFPKDRFEVANLATLSNGELSHFESDIVVASGIFYFRRDEPQRFMQEMVKRMFGTTKRTLAFNSLSTWADRPAGPIEYRADPIETLRFCHGLTPWCILRHDYHPGDFTIIMRRARLSEAPL